MEKAVGKSRFKWLKITLGVVAGLVALVFIALRLVLTPSFLTSMVNKYAAPLVDGELSFGRIDASVFSSFPKVGITIEDALLTYPHDRFAAWDSVGVRSFLRSRGRAPERDTLLSVRRLYASADVFRLASGRIHISEVSLDKPRIFAHKFDSLAANWNIFVSGSEEKEDTTSSSGLPHIILHKVALTGRPVIVYTSLPDTTFATLRLKQMDFGGRIDIADLQRHRIDLDLDSLFVHGRLPADTLAAGVDHLGIHQRKDVYDIDLAAKAFLALRSTGRLRLPVGLSASVSFPDSSFNSVSLRNLQARVATLALRGDGDVKMAGDSTYIKAELAVDTCSVDRTIKYFAPNFAPSLLKLHTDAVISLTALCDGWYIPSSGSLPELIAEVVIPKASVAYDGMDYKGRVAADINAQTDRYGRLDVSLDEMELDIAGASLSGTGSAEDVLGDDPLVQLDLVADADLARLEPFFPEGIEADGLLNIGLSGCILLSDMSLYNFSRADLEGFVSSSEISVLDEPDSISAWLGKTDIQLGKGLGGTELGKDILGFKGQIDTLFATYGGSTVLKGSRIGLTAHNAAKAVSEEYGNEVHPIVGALTARNVTMTGQDSLFLSIRGTRNNFKYSSKADGGNTLPILSVNSSNRGIFLRSGCNRIGLRGTTLSASAVKKGSERVARRNKLLDSLQKVYPGVQRDSLLRWHFRRRREAAGVPEWMQESDFKSSDIKIDLGRSVADYFRNWNLGGSLAIESGRLTTPYFPLRNTMEKVEGSFDNNNLNLKNLTFRAGESDLSASGKVAGLQRAFSGRGIINVTLDLTSELLNANELLAAYDAGVRFRPEGSSDVQGLTDDEYMEKVLSEADTSSGTSLIVLPANVDATMSIQGNEIKYSDLDVNWFASDIKMKQRTLQVTNTVATSNMGDIYFEGFYSSRTKKDITAGFDLNMVDITADKVITLYPAVDSIIPMLKTFKGMLDCEIAATTQLDTAMNILMPTINGVMSIKGSDLSIHDGGGFRKIANILMFKDKTIGKIQDMSVQGLIADNRLVIFPFVLSVDRYSLAMSGLQNFDQSFNYHVSVLKSPLPFRFGVDLTGNFDDWKWKLVKARYKDANVPVFSKELGDVQVNLVNSIHNIFTRGVEEAVRANIAGNDALEARAGRDVYASGESLDGDRQSQIDSLRNAYEHPQEAGQPLDSLLNAKIDSIVGSVAPEPQKKECWLKRLFTCKKKEAIKEDE